MVPLFWVLFENVLGEGPWGGGLFHPSIPCLHLYFKHVFYRKWFNPFYIGTQLWKDVSKGLVKLPMEDEMADMYDVALETIERFNFRRYEVSNFSKSTNDESIHNWNYWKVWYFELFEITP